MVIVEGPQVRVYTNTLTAVFDRGVLVSLARKSDGKEFVKAGPEGASPLGLAYGGGDYSELGSQKDDKVTCLQLGKSRAQMRFECWYGDAVLDVSEDPETGDLIVEPSAYASRPGLRSCRWTISGIEPELDLVAPLFQGVKLPLEDLLIANSYRRWPHGWEAGLVILQGRGGGFWVHCRDTQYRYKGVQIGTKKDPRCLGFETESYGPLERNLSAGGIAWRVNVFDGDWKKPAAIYHDWLWKAWGLDGQTRPEWLHDLRFAIAWCPSDMALLDALAAKVEPKKVLLHIPFWRTDAYDENYPTFVASDQGKAFIKKAQGMGFHAMPHMNSIDMDPTNPAYTYLRDFQYRGLEDGCVQGWTWFDGEVKPVPESNVARLLHRSSKTMVKIHPGLSMWRSILAENVLLAAQALSLDEVFLDVTLNTWNLRNCLVDDMTPTEGMKRLVSLVATLGNGLAVGGEGRNEITMQDQFMGQAHLFESWQESVDGLERTGGCDLNEFLFGKICRTFGYTGLGGRDANEEMRMRLHVEHGAIPTVTVRRAADIANPNKAVKELLDMAGR